MRRSLQYSFLMLPLLATALFAVSAAAQDVALASTGRGK